MSKNADELLRQQINNAVQDIKSAGFQPPTKLAYVYKHTQGVVIEPGRKNAGNVRTLAETNRRRKELKLEPLTREEYSLSIKGIADMDKLSPDAIREYHAKQIADYLNKDIPLTNEERQLLFDKVATMTDKELSELISSYSGKEGGDAYTNIHNWIRDNVLDKGDK